ncbi:hypothetical protein R1sor_023874 [Riccia sorocarpa]|uniref:SWIM-type domain-containing protein n=1 Tax=Riccia sorocarpa TaxID=122646 RepID=A0ABD3GPN4_9MARC
MEGVNYMDGSDIEETIFNPGEMTVEEWEELNDHRWYRESPVFSHVLNAVEEAAGRIRFGEVFASFNEFELCLDCWCVVNMRASHKFKRNPDCRVRICRYGLPARKKGVGKSCEWTPSEPSGSSQGLELPHVLGVRSFNDFAARRLTLAFPTVRPDRPDLNLEEQVFSQCTQRQKKRVGVKGGCGEKDRYDAAQMVRFTHADSDGDDLDEDDIEGDEEDCDDDPKKVGRKTPSRGTRCEWRVRCHYNKKSDEYKITTPEPYAYMSMASTQVERANVKSPVNLVASIEGLESPNVIIVSDRQKGLEKAVAEVLPRNFHMHCAHHLKMNVIKHFGAGKAFLTLVYMDDQASYERRLVEMETRSSKGPDLVRYIRQIPMDRYVRFAIPLPRYGRTTSNIVECINGALKPVRDYAPCHIIWQMWNYMLNLFYARREKTRQSSEELTEFATKRMKEIVQNCGSFVAMSADENEALMQTNGGRKQWRLTKLPTRKCTCWEIQDCLWPCIHFVAWQKAIGEDYMRYVDRIYFTKTLVQCYSKTIPVILQTELPMSVACRAPPGAIRNGRQRIVRIPNGGSARSAESEYSYPIQDDPAMNPAAVMTNVSQEDGGERGNPLVPQSSAPQGEQLSQAPPVARSKGRRCCGACKEPGHTRLTCPALRQYRRAEVEEGLDVAADG